MTPHIIRRKIASKFGKTEHRFGELLGIWLIGLAVIMPKIYHITSAVLWLIYFISHKAEKKIYGKHGFR